MHLLLAAVNAKYIHSNPGVYSLKMYADRVQKPEAYAKTSADIEIAEYTINNFTEQMLEDIYRRKPDAVGFSCYIWNITCVTELVRDLHKILPDTDIWLGGPEVSYDAKELLEREPELLGIMKGEGEEIFAELTGFYRTLGTSVRCAERKGQAEQKKIAKPLTKGRQHGGESFRKGLEQIPGLVFRKENGEIWEQETRTALDMDRLPFIYEGSDGYEHRILYYESSRGCPFSCSYCLSSLDKSVRFRKWELVKKELDFFLEQKVPQVKFVDRTFNCSKSHAMAIWRHIAEHDNGITNFHFEIAADLMDEEELSLMEKVRPGLIQLEIGVQSTNPVVIREICRKMDWEKVRKTAERIHGGGRVHQHLDLIAGLPYEDYDSFHRSFNDVYTLEPEQLQLGFLKVLKGSHMYKMAERYGLVYREQPPYEVLATHWLSYEEIRRLKGVENMVEVYYNSGQFGNILKLLVDRLKDAFHLYEQLAEYYEEQGLNGKNHSRMARYEILYGFILKQTEMERGRDAAGHVGNGLEEMEDALVCDCYLRENCKSRPVFALDQVPYKEQIRTLAAGFRSLGTQVHAEVLRSGEVWLFDYRDREPLSRNARMVLLGRI